jgi:hypothetical protein
LVELRNVARFLMYRGARMRYGHPLPCNHPPAGGTSDYSEYVRGAVRLNVDFHVNYTKIIRFLPLEALVSA